MIAPAAIALLLSNAAPVDAEDRALAATTAAIGATVGAVTGASASLFFGASLSGFNAQAVGVPYAVLPGAFAAVGAGACAGAATGSRAGWSATLGALAGAGVASLAVDAWMLDGRTHNHATTFALAIGAPAVAGAVTASIAAAIFVDSP